MTLLVRLMILNEGIFKIKSLKIEGGTDTRDVSERSKRSESWRRSGVVK